MKYTVKQFGQKLNGKFGLCGEISGLTRENVISQIHSLQLRKKLQIDNNGVYTGSDMITIFDENGGQHTTKEFVNP